MLEILMAFAPLIFLIVYALKTRRMAESMVLATLLAMALLHRRHFLTAPSTACTPCCPARRTSSRCASSSASAA